HHENFLTRCSIASIQLFQINADRLARNRGRDHRIKKTSLSTGLSISMPASMPARSRFSASDVQDTSCGTWQLSAQSPHGSSPHPGDGGNIPDDTPLPGKTCPAPSLP